MNDDELDNLIRRLISSNQRMGPNAVVVCLHRVIRYKDIELERPCFVLIQEVQQFGLHLLYNAEHTVLLDQTLCGMWMATTNLLGNNVFMFDNFIEVFYLGGS